MKRNRQFEERKKKLQRTHISFETFLLSSIDLFLFIQTSCTLEINIHSMRIKTTRILGQIENASSGESTTNTQKTGNDGDDDSGIGQVNQRAHSC